MNRALIEHRRAGLPEVRGAEQHPLHLALVVVRRWWLLALPVGLLLGAVGAAVPYLFFNDRSVLVSGAVAAETDLPLVPLGAHALRGIAAPCAVFTLPEG